MEKTANFSFYIQMNWSGHVIIMHISMYCPTIPLRPKWGLTGKVTQNSHPNMGYLTEV